MARGLWCGILICVLFTSIEAFVLKPEFEIEYKKDFAYLKTDYYKLPMEPGFPDIPVYRKKISGVIEDISIKLINQDTIYLSAYLIPIKKPIPKSNHVYDTYSINEEFYSTKSKILKNEYNIIHLNNMDILEVYPFNYIPSKSILLINTYSIDIQVFKNEVKAIDNNIVIVYHSDFYDIINETEWFFKLRGKAPESFSINETGSTPDSIRAFLINKYNSTPFSFILLMGSRTKIPGNWGIGDGTPYTDLNYTLMDTMDYLPDVIISRLPFDSSSMFLEYFEKVEKSLADNTDKFKNNAYFMASNDDNYHLVAENTQIYSMEKFRQIDYNTDSLFYYYNSGTPVSEAINDGREMVFYSGHGSAYTWDGPSFSDSDIEDLNNTPYFPFIFSFACLTGNYYYTSFFGGNWIDKFNRGAIGFIGSTQLTYWEQDDVLQRYVIDSLINGDYILNAMNKGKMQYLIYYGDTLSMTRRYFEKYNCFTIPDIYFGNFGIGNISINYDKYQIASESDFSFNIDFDGTINKSAFCMLGMNGNISDSISISLPSDYNLTHTYDIGDTADFSIYIPGRFLKKQLIIFIDDGPFVALNSYNVADIKVDTLIFDLDIKNFGNAQADSIFMYMKYIPEHLNLLDLDDFIDSIPSSSLFHMNNGLKMLMSSDSFIESDTLCSLNMVFSNNTVTSLISVSELRPSFSVEYNYSICGNDTNEAVTMGKVNIIHFTAKNTSSVKSKNIIAAIECDNAELPYPSISIDSLSPDESRTLLFGINPNNAGIDEISIIVSMNLGSYKSEHIFSIPLKLKSSYAFLGPVNNYYIYTSDMVNLENRPIFFDIREERTGWNVINFDDDETVKIDIPFEFNLNGVKHDALFLNANGILAVDSIRKTLYTIMALPSTDIEQPSFVCAWQDYRFSDIVFISDNLDDLNGFVVYKTNEINANLSILYNNVINSRYDTFSFLIQADTNNINIHFYDISCSDSIVNGIQFDSEHYLGFTGDSFFMSNGAPLIRDSMSISFSNVPPVLATKFFSERFTGTHKPILMSGSLYYKNNDFVIGVFENNIYSVNLYDLNGRLCQELDNGIIRKGTYHYKNEQQVSGVYFLIINNGKEVLLRRKIVIFQ